MIGPSRWISGWLPVLLICGIVMSCNSPFRRDEDVKGQADSYASWLRECVGEPSFEMVTPIDDRLIELFVRGGYVEGFVAGYSSMDLDNQLKQTTLRVIVSNPRCRCYLRHRSDGSGAIDYVMMRRGLWRVKKRLESVTIDAAMLDCLHRINSYFLRNRVVKRRYLDYEAVTWSVLNAATISNATHMLRYAEQEQQAEVGGFVLIEHPGGGIPPVLHFHHLPSDGLEWAARLQKELDHTQKLVELIETGSPPPYFLRDRFALARRELRNCETPEKRYARARIFADHYLYIVRYSYIFPQKQYYRYLSRQQTRGYYLGVFHVHPPENPPSAEDKYASIFRRNLVLVPRQTGFDLHYLFQQENPDSPWKTISYRNPE